MGSSTGCSASYFKARRLMCPANVNFSGNSMHFHSPTTIPYVSAQRMLPLFLNYDRNIRLNFSRNRLRGKTKIRRGGHIYVDASGYRFEIPIPVLTGITANDYFARHIMGLSVEFSALYIN